MKKIKLVLILVFLCFLKAEASDLDKWTVFIENLQSQMQGQVQPPYEPVKILADKYLPPESIVLDIGCEIGKNAAYLIKKGHKVVLLDIAPNALLYTAENLKNEGLEEGILDFLNMKIEEMDFEYIPFDAIVGTYAFSFISPEVFLETMTKNILDRIQPGGYFAGGFFGEEHSWAIYSGMSILTIEKLEQLFSSAGFTIIELEEVKEDIITISGDLTRFHTYDVIALKL